MQHFPIINSDSIDSEYDSRHGGSKYYRIGYPFGSFIVYKEYPSFSEQDALDTFADWAIDNAPGYCADERHIEELREDAIKHNRDDEDIYVDEYYIRAGNDSHYICMPECIDFWSQSDLDNAREAK